MSARAEQSPIRAKVQQVSMFEWDVVDVATGRVLVSRESFTIADRVAEFVNHPERDDNSESAEVARSIRDWMEHGIGWSANDARG